MSLFFRASQAFASNYNMASHSSIFLTAVSNTFIRFIHFEFGTNHADYLDATETQQRVLIEDDTKDTCAYMSCTKVVRSSNCGQVCRPEPYAINVPLSRQRD